MAQARGHAARRGTVSRLTARRLGGALLGVLLSTLVAWSPPAVQPAYAAGPLQVRAEARYTVDPDAGRVHVAVDYTVTNNKPNTPTVIYYYRDLTFGVQPDVRQVRASDGSGSLGVSTRDRDGYTQVDVRLRANLYYRRSTSFTLRYDIVGGAPRSETPVRVGQAFVTFGVWAFGDANRGTVEVHVPPGFTNGVVGDALPQVSGGVGSGAVLRTRPADPDSFFAIVSMERQGSYEKTRLALPGGIDIVVLAWPEDPEWAESVATTMERGIPRLEDLIGIEWPVFRDLNVTERYTPALEGYAGFFLADSQRIEMSEDLDRLTTLHEASHVWFNQSLFPERWITEGLAEDYAVRVDTAIGGGPYDPPVEPDPEDPAFVRLNLWVFPTVVRDDTDATEIYGYRAAAWIMREIVEAAGVDRMREAFRAADANLTAYPGAGSPEHVGIRDTWKRFLDLTQPIEEPDPEEILRAIEELVLAPGDAGLLDRRSDARDAYRALLAAGAGWLPPWYIREPMGEWEFADAEARMAGATAVLALRDQVDAAAAAEGLTLDDSLKAAYEGAEGGFAGALALAEEQRAAIAAIAAARGKVDAEPDLVSQIGLMGEVPRVPYEAARAAFEAGDLGGALAEAGAAVAVIDRAPALGQERLLLGAVVAAGLLILLVAAILLLRRRRRRRAAAIASTTSLAALDARFLPAAGPEPSATLGADPDGPAPPPDEPPPDEERGPTHT